ncbi:hypothetical protein ACQ4PT_019159 [Festuca glaucescens]
MGSPLMASWKVSFRKVSDLDLVDSLPTDGELFVWSCSPRNWITLMDSSGAAVATRHSHEGEVIEAGSYVTFPRHVAKVGTLVPSVPKVCCTTQGFTSSSVRYAGVVDLEAFEAKSRANLVSNNPVSRGDLLGKKWRITYSTTKDIDRGRMKSYDGILELDDKDQWLRLPCARGLQIGCRFLQKGDQFSIGAKLYFPIHIVRIGVPIQNYTSSGCDCMDHADSVSALMTAQKSDYVCTTMSAADASVTKPVIFPSTDSVVTSVAETLILSDGSASSGVASKDGGSSPVAPSAISLGLNSSHGSNFAKDDRQKFGLSVHPSERSGHFLMVVSFGRSSFRLDEDSVGIALESAIGGHGGRMKVSALGDRVFSFCISTAFGKYHHWHQDDAFKERTMIFVTFDSPASVPRDIVFSNYANIGDVKETWTAPCYVLGADFADVLPADEDQMPLDGNPHPLPGNMVVDNNMMVLPPFPQLGWNNAPLHGQQAHNVQPGENIQVEEPEQNVQEQPVEELVDDSIVVDLSVAEGADADMEEGEVNQPVHALQDMLGQQ